MKTSLDFTSLHMCAIFGTSKVCKKLLKMKGNEIEVNAGDDDDVTALHYAAQNGHIEIMEFLLQHPNIDVNCRDIRGNTPLHFAGLYGRKDSIILLLKQKGIKPAAMNDVLIILFF